MLESGAGGVTGTGGTASSRRKDGRGTKRGRDEDDASRKPDMKLNVPEILKVLLVDDWEAVTKNNQVRPTIDFESSEYLIAVNR
jgi:mortality factor 4-like protein 1